MIKQIRSVVYMILGTVLVGCNSGGGGNATISATASGCSPATQNSCKISLTYNTQGSALSLSLSGNTLSQFVFPLNACNVTATNGNQTCTLNVVYNSSGQPVTENVSFVLGSGGTNSVTSNKVTLSGN